MGNSKKKALEILAGFDKSKEEEDKVSWIKATEKNTIAGYQDYLERYPSGAFETEAQAALEELRGSKPFHDQRRRSLLKLLIISVILIIVVVLMIGDFFK